ncbi:MAG: hypothetical protein AAFY21_02255 [Cyanobacteria bacterium J06641_2]
MPYLKRGESFATGMVRPRSTALFFDKLWVHPALIEGNLFGSMKKYAVPAQLCVSNPLGATEYYMAYGYNAGFFAWDRKRPDWKDFGVANSLDETYELYRDRLLGLPFRPSVSGFFSSEYANKIFERSFQFDSIKEFRYREERDFQPFGYRDTFGGETTTQYRNKAIHDIVNTYAQRGIELTPIYLHHTQLDEVTPTENPGIEVCLDFIPIVIDAELTWEQVLEFRKDKDARKKLNRLRRWFTADLLQKNEKQVKAILSKRLEEYQWALKKHGIQTVVGGFTSVLSCILTPTALELLSSNSLAAVAGGVTLTSGAVAWITNKLIERTEIKTQEIAYIYEVRKMPT